MPGETESRVVLGLFDLLPVSRTAAASLRRRLTAPERHYHSLHHVALLWQRHLRFGAGTVLHDPAVHRLVAAAIAYHDAIYDARRRDNERRSAMLWRNDARSASRLTPAEIEWVSGTIEATDGHLVRGHAADPLSLARAWMLDLDLTPLGERPDIFARNTDALRAENAHLDAPVWNLRRLAFLATLQGRARLFRTPRIAAAFEARARANLDRELRPRP